MSTLDSDDYDALLARHYENIRKRAETAIRRVIHREWRSRLRAAHATLRGQTFPHIGHRVRRAQELTGLTLDEVYGGTLPSDLVLSVSRGSDVQQADFADDSIVARAQALGIGEEVIAQCIVEARSGVRESKRLLKARAVVEEADNAHAFTRADLESFKQRFNRNRRQMKR